MNASPSFDLKIHVKVIGWLYILLGALGLVGAACVFVILLGSGIASGDRTAITVLPIVAVSVTGLVTLLSIPGVIAGFGLLKLKPWARVLALALAILNLPNVPLGTILGLYALLVLLSSDASTYFNGGSGQAS
jgi:hypothetical protein